MNRCRVLTLDIGPGSRISNRLGRHRHRRQEFLRGEKTGFLALKRDHVKPKIYLEPTAHSLALPLPLAF